MYVVKSRDKKYKPRPPTQIDASLVVKVEKRVVVLVRHGESLWNVVANRSKMPIFFIARLIKAIVQEVVLIVKGVDDSIILDSPLSPLGMHEAKHLHDHLFKHAPVVHDPSEAERKKLYYDVLRGDVPSIVTTSNLRRAITTCALSLRTRLSRTEEHVLVLPCLQEISQNPDAMSVLHPHSTPAPAITDRKSHDGQYIVHVYAKQLDASFNTGNKGVNSTGQERIASFTRWLFTQPKNAVVVGHSLWIRSFFREYLYEHVSHAAKERKVSNCAAIGCEIEQYTLRDGSIVHVINRESISLLDGKFKK